MVWLVGEMLNPDVERETKRCLDERRAAMSSSSSGSSVSSSSSSGVSSAIALLAPRGTLVVGNIMVVDRKAAYLNELRDMQHFPGLKALFTDPVAFLRACNADGEDLGLYNASVPMLLHTLFGKHLGKAKMKEHFKSLYKVAYGKFANAKTADAGMSAEKVAALRNIAELVRRRNAVKVLAHAKWFGDNCLGYFTDSLMLKGKDADEVLAQMNTQKTETWEVEFQGDLALLGATNCHILHNSKDGTTEVRPHEMFGKELTHSGWTKEFAEHLKQRLLTAAMSRDAKELTAVRDLFPAKLSIPNSKGVCSMREPSARRLLGYVLERLTVPKLSSQLRHHTGDVSNKQCYSLQEALRSQRLSLSNAFVVGCSKKNASGREFRTFLLVAPDKLKATCFGKCAHMIYSGVNVGFRAHLDWDNTDASLTEERLQQCVRRLKSHWWEKKSVRVEVQVLRTHTHRTGAKAHCEHVVFIARDAEGVEYVLLNVAEIPKSLGLDDAFDVSIYAANKSLRMAGCPTLAGRMETAHVPVGETQDWNPSNETYLRWCPNVVLGDNVCGHCDEHPVQMQHRDDGMRYFFASEKVVLQGFWDYLHRQCRGYKFGRQSLRYYQLNQEYNQFLINVEIERSSSKARFLDFQDFMKRVMVPHLCDGDTKVPSAGACNHRTSNKSYFLLNLSLGSGELSHIKGKSHAPKTRDGAEQSPPQRKPVAKRRKQQTNLLNFNRGETLEMGRAVLARMLTAQQQQQHRRLRSKERSVALCLCRLKVSLKSNFFPEDDSVLPVKVRRALLLRHRVFRRRAMGNPVIKEVDETSHQHASLSVAFLVDCADKALAQRAIDTERQFYTSHFGTKEFTARMVDFLDAQQVLLDSRQADATPAYGEDSAWSVVILFAQTQTYRDEVY